MEQNKKATKPWYKKPGVILMVVILVIAIFVNLNTNSPAYNSSSNSSTNTTNSTQQKKWTEVYAFAGNGMKKSPSFALYGNDAKLKYIYQAPDGLHVGLFSVYVVNDGIDVMKTGGIPDVITQSENEESESAIQKVNGRYYLNVNAAGNWQVSILEYK